MPGPRDMELTGTFHVHSRQVSTFFTDVGVKVIVVAALVRR